MNIKQQKNTRKNKKRHSTKKIISTITEGVLETVTNLILYQVFLSTSLIGATTSSKIYQSFNETDKLLQEINYQTIKTAIYKLCKQGILEKSKEKRYLRLKITKQVLKRINSKIPQYDKKRLWDNNLYLISYDIPTKANFSRDKLRKFLRQIGCALLQESLWLTPYNPQQLINTFTKNQNINGTILISRLGKNGAIGNENLKDLLNRVYKLKELNDQYKEFIKEFSNPKNTLSPLSITMKYYALLKNDPQLPFELLPSDFLSSKAYKIAKKHGSLLVSHVRKKRLPSTQ